MVTGIMTIKDGAALVWNRTKGVTRTEMVRLVAVLQKVPGVEAFALSTSGPGMVVKFPAPNGCHTDILHKKKIATYSVVLEVTDLL